MSTPHPMTKDVATETNSSLPAPTTPVAHPPTSDPVAQTNAAIPNVIIFGETGTGKSSLINMLGGQPLAGVSSQALGFTFANQPYVVKLDQTSYRLWDTAGLNEGQQGTMPGEDALNNLRKLVQSLPDGVNLLVHCIHGTRFRDILRVNYDLFTGIICQEKVPVVVVVTGLENESPDMDTWWTNNEQEFKACGLDFKNHACVTTAKGKKMKDEGYMFQEEYDESEKKVRELLVKECSGVPWKVESEQWMKEIGVRMEAYMERYNNRSGSEREALHLQPEADEKDPSSNAEGQINGPQKSGGGWTQVLGGKARKTFTHMNPLTWGK